MSEGSKHRLRAVWETPQCPFRIEYSAAMLNQIRMAAVEAYYSVPRGGVEIGGVLFGSIEPGRVIIRTFRRMECEHASGPTFALSERDLEGLERLLRESETDASLAGQKRVGWFHSHTRSEVCLTEADLDIYHGFFPGPMEVALVVRPLHLKPTRAGFFFRDAAGNVQAEASFKEFIADSAYLQTFTTDEPPPAAEAIAPVAPPAAASQTALAGPPGNEPALHHFGKWIVAAILAGVLSSAAVIAVWRPRTVASSPPAPAPAPVTVPQDAAFEAVELEGQTVLRWNRQSPAVQHADGGVLEIHDGNQQKQVPLEPDDLRRGVALYRRTSPRVEFRLRLWQPGQPPIEELAAVSGASQEARSSSGSRGRQRRRR